MDAQFLRSMNSFANKLHRAVLVQEVPITGWSTVKGCFEPEGTTLLGEPEPIGIGAHWFDETRFFMVKTKVPACFDGKRVWLHFSNDGESLLYLNGVPVVGFDRNRSQYDLGIGRQQDLDIRVESALRWQNYAHANQDGTHYELQIFRQGSFLEIDEELEECAYTVGCILEHYLQYGDSFSAGLLKYARFYLKPDDGREAYRTHVRKCMPYLREQLSKAREQKGRDAILVIGHSHLDLGYLWPSKETIRKCGRTFSNMLDLMDHYPEFHFTQSQPYLYEIAKKYYPELFRRLKEYVQQGRWEIAGGMYVEADGNMPSGESFIRQMLYGCKKMEAEFGIRMQTGWLPDTFGLSAILPQIHLKSGLKYFYSNKLRTNKHYAFPFSLYEWEGIDGSRILAEMEVYNTYAGNMTIRQIQDGQDYYKQKEAYPDSTMYLCGFGDGGGGATREMLERARRYDCLPNLPRICCATATEFFEGVKKAHPQLPLWFGEHYLDSHQGTLTTKAALKRHNRLCERKLRDAEILGVLSGSGRRDQDELKGLWEPVLYNQFHDIISGSMLQSVSDEAVHQYERVERRTDALCESYLHKFPADTGEGFSVWNTLSFPRMEYIEAACPVGYVVIAADGEKPEQTRLSEDTVLLAAALPALGCSSYRVQADVEGSLAYPPLTREEAEVIRLENSCLSVTIEKRSGYLLSVYDKEEQSETIQGAGNMLEYCDELYEFYSAWNIDADSLKNLHALPPADHVEIVEDNGLRARIRVKRRFLHSSLTQTILFYKDCRRIDFDTQVSWQETDVLLHVRFDTDILSPTADFDLSYGNVQRSTRDNMDYERAQIEVCGHQWADLSDRGRGASLLNDCKYGYRVKGSSLCLTLLKSPKYPDPESDMGNHHFTYSFYPHKGDFRSGGTVQAALQLNHPPLIGRSPSLNTASYITISRPNVLLGALKFAYDGSGDRIMRLYENEGASGLVSILLNDCSFQSACACNLLEEPEEDLCLEGGKLSLRFTPYEIKTIRLR